MYTATEFGGILDGKKNEKTPCHGRCDTISIPACSKVIRAIKGLNYKSLEMVTFQFEYR